MLPSGLHAEKLTIGAYALCSAPTATSGPTTGIQQDMLKNRYVKKSVQLTEINIMVLGRDLSCFVSMICWFFIIFKYSYCYQPEK